MDRKVYQVKVGNEVRQYEEGTTFAKIAKEYQNQYENEIVLVFEDKKLQELRKGVTKDCTLRFVTTGDSVGNQTYRRSMCLMLVKAIYDACEHKDIWKVRIHFSLSKGYYCTIEGDVAVDQRFLDKVKSRMLEMVAEKMPIDNVRFIRMRQLLYSTNMECTIKKDFLNTEECQKSIFIV